MIHYSQCPLCGSTDIAGKFSVKDYTVSQNNFAVWFCNKCTAGFTQDIPSQNEIGVYYQSENYISHSDTKKGIVNRLYHIVRNRTLTVKKKLLIKFTGKLTGSVLDIGCGTGAFLNTMKISGWQIAGLEPDETARKKAQELYSIASQPSENLFALNAASFDAITMWHVLEHVHGLHDYLKQIAALLKPDGKLFIAVPNYTSADAAHYKQYWAAYDVPRHLYHFSPESMRDLLLKYNLQVQAIKPMWYDSFYVSMLSEKYKNGKGDLLKAFWNGFVSNLKTLGNKERCSSVVYIISKK